MWAMLEPAIKIAERLTTGAHKLPPEVLKLDDGTAAFVVEVDGVDYIMTVARVPKQRAKPATN